MISIPTNKELWNKILPDPNHCERCGRRIFNGSSICYKCNKEFQKYMKEHPLKDYTSIEESKERWRNFVGGIE